MRALFYNDNGQEYEVTDAETGERIVGVQAFSEKSLHKVSSAKFGLISR